MSTHEFPESFDKRVVIYYQILKEGWMFTPSHEQHKERERRRRYSDEVDRFLGLKS